MKNITIYLFPLTIDIVISLALFVSRHSFAEQGMSARLVGSIIVIFGVIYLVSSFIMGKIIRVRLAKRQIIISLVLIMAVLACLANVKKPALVLVLFGFLPFAASMFFNAFQSFMLHVETAAAKSLAKSVGQYTFAWSPVMPWVPSSPRCSRILSAGRLPIIWQRSWPASSGFWSSCLNRSKQWQLSR